MSDFTRAVAMLKSGLTVDVTMCDTGPRFETLLNQSVYLGIWCYSDAAQTLFTLEVREVADDSMTWFEDGPTLNSGSEVRFFETFGAAFANLNVIVEALADREAV